MSCPKLCMAFDSAASHVKRGGIHRPALEGNGIMNKDRIAGAAKEAAGSIKAGIGEALSDARMLAEGRADKAAGRIQSAAGALDEAVAREQARKASSARADAQAKTDIAAAVAALAAAVKK